MSLVDKVVGTAALLGGILLAFAGWQLNPGTSKLPGPGFFPLLIAGTMGGLGIWLLLRPGPADQPSFAGSSRWGSLAIALLSIIGYAIVLSELGYLLSTFGLLTVQLRWVEKRTWPISLAAASLAAALSLVIFRVLLKVPLPVGILPLPKGW